MNPETVMTLVEAPAPPPLRETIRVDVINCDRCSGNHMNVLFTKFKQSSGWYTHWSMCSRTGEPIMLRSF